MKTLFILSFIADAAAVWLLLLGAREAAWMALFLAVLLTGAAIAEWRRQRAAWRRWQANGLFTLNRPFLR